MDQIQPYIDDLSAQLDRNPTIRQLAQKTGVPSGYIALGLVGVCFLFVLLGIGGSFITDLVGIFYPAYMSFKAIESPGGDDDKLWLTYWVVFAFYAFADNFLDILFFWVPCYYAIKLLVLVALFAPQIRGAVLLYDGVIRPLLKKHEDEIDKALHRVEQDVDSVAKKAKEEAMNQATKIAYGSGEGKND
jgi:receptor expression-enhancing protein 5/6